MKLVDITLLIDLLNDEPGIRNLVREIDSEMDHHTSVISKNELLTGALTRGEKNADLCIALLSRFDIADFYERYSEKAAMIYLELEKSGQDIPSQDIMIAGIARSKGFTILTRDTSISKG